MKRGDLLQMGLIFLLAFALRFHGLDRPASRWLDENNNMDGAVNYCETGQFEPEMWDHPPLRNLTAYAFLKGFGDNPYGWRMRNVLLGAVTAVLAWLFAYHVGGRRTALLAGLLVATDPLHVVLSRFTFEEIHGAAFFLGAVVLYLRHRERALWLAASAFLMGCALATKWNFVPGWLLMLVLLLRENGNYRNARKAIFLTCTWTLIPLGVYLASYWPWFGRGYRLGELPELVLNGYHHLQSMTEFYVRVIDRRVVYQTHMSALEWFTRPIAIGDGYPAAPGRWEFIVYFNNLPIWGLTFPALIAMVILSLRRREASLALPATFFSATYLLFLFVDRPVFIYSAVPLVPFAFTAIAFVVAKLSDRLGIRFYGTVAAVMLGWNLYVYPLVSTKPVPLAPYRYFLENSEITVH